jgi:hypothetical protein
MAQVYQHQRHRAQQMPGESTIPGELASLSAVPCLQASSSSSRVGSGLGAFVQSALRRVQSRATEPENPYPNARTAHARTSHP